MCCRGFNPCFALVLLLCVCYPTIVQCEIMSGGMPEHTTNQLLLTLQEKLVKMQQQMQQMRTKQEEQRQELQTLKVRDAERLQVSRSDMHRQPKEGDRAGTGLPPASPTEGPLSVRQENRGQVGPGQSGRPTAHGPSGASVIRSVEEHIFMITVIHAMMATCSVTPLACKWTLYFATASFAAVAIKISVASMRFT